jgi:diguanylate cyclase (GGDEF)-like protein
MIERQLAETVFSRDNAACDPDRCALPVDSDDEAGSAAGAFNRLIRTVARSHAVEVSLHEFSGLLSREFEVDGLCRSSLEGLLRTTRADAGAMFVARDEQLTSIASFGLRDVDDLASNDHVRRAVRTGKVARLRVAPDGMLVDSLLLTQAPADIVVVPVEFKSVPLGVVVLAAAAAFDEDGIALLDQLRADLGLALNNALVHDRLERLAAIDPLTDAYNRRFGLARLREEFSRAVRAEAPLGILMVDIDLFKSVNDTYGHLVGDRVLRTIADTMRRVIREGDVLIRFGGEEFLLLLPGAGPESVAQIGERIRRSIAETVTMDAGTQISVTVSLGGAVYRDATASPEALVDAADHALYEAKQTGRNRLALAA